MSIDEKSRRIAQAHLLPGETLAWAGPAVTPGRTALALLVGAATFLGVVILGTGGAMFTSSVFSFPVIFGVFVGALASALVLVMAVVSDRANNKPTHYAITDRRILFLSTRTGETIPVAAYGPQDIPFVRRQDRRDGTSDLFLFHAGGPTRGTLEINGIAVPYQGPTPDIALRGVADAGAVEALIVALQAGQLAGTIPAPPEPPSEPLSEMAGEREIILSKFTTPWMAGVMCLLVGLPFLGMGITVGIGRSVMYSGEGASATPASPLDGLFAFGGVGLACILLGGGLLLWRDVLTADPAARTYRIRRGFAPFAKTTAGTFADFGAIRFTRESTKSPDEIYWHVRLHWKEAGRKPYGILETRFAPHGADRAARMAALLGLPLGDRSAEVTPTEKKAQAVRADPRTPAREARGRRLKIAGGGVLGLLLVNSFVKGVVYEDHWTAPDGSAITRCTTGFWWQTVAVSPQGKRSSETHDQYFSSHPLRPRGPCRTSPAPGPITGAACASVPGWRRRTVRPPTVCRCRPPAVCRCRPMPCRPASAAGSSNDFRAAPRARRTRRWRARSTRSPTGIRGTGLHRPLAPAQ